MSHEHQGPREIAVQDAAFPRKGCRRRGQMHEFEGGYFGVVAANASKLIGLTLDPTGVPSRKTYVTMANGKHSRWVLGLDGLLAILARTRGIENRARVSALIDWCRANGISETLWPEGAAPAEATSEPVAEKLPVVMPKWDGKGSPFDAAREIDERGREYWEDRRLQGPAGYSKWQHFEMLVDKAEVACRNSGQRVEDHFTETRKMVSLGSGSSREIRCRRLTRYACYLVFMNGDPNKPEIAAAQQYFAIRTHQAERAEEKARSSDFDSVLEALRMLTMLGQNHAGAIAGLDSRTAELQKELETTRLRSAKALELAEHVQDRMNGLAGPFTVNEWCQKHGYRLTPREKQLLGTFLSYEAKQRNARTKDSCKVTPIYGVASYKINAYPIELLREFDRYFADYRKHEHEWIGVARTIDAARRKARETERAQEGDDQPKQSHLF